MASPVHWQAAVMKRGRWIKGKEKPGKHVLHTKTHPTGNSSVHSTGAVQWRGMTDHPPCLHLVVNRYLGILWGLAAPCMTVSFLSGTQGHSLSQQRSNCSDSPPLPLIVQKQDLFGFSWASLLSHSPELSCL